MNCPIYQIKLDSGGVSWLVLIMLIIMSMGYE